MSTLDTLRWQFDLTWRLAEHYLPMLDDAACLWAPAEDSWTVRRGADGLWRPDWAEAEPEPAPTTSVGWLSWHLIWWWSGLIAAVRDAPPPARDGVFWPGDGATAQARLNELAAEWSDVLAKLDEIDLSRAIAYPWAEARPMRIALAWGNAELMKNVAEIGAGVRLYQSRGRSRLAN